MQERIPLEQLVRAGLQGDALDKEVEKRLGGFNDIPCPNPQYTQNTCSGNCPSHSLIAAAFVINCERKGLDFEEAAGMARKRAAQLTSTEKAGINAQMVGAYYGCEQELKM